MATRRRWPEREISALGAEQRLLVASRQLAALGVSSSAIAHAVARRRLHRYCHGVYALVELRALPPLAAEQAATLACGPAAVISHRSAAALWGLLDPFVGPVSLTVAGSDAGRKRRGIDFQRARGLAAVDVRRHRGLPVTAPARTLIDAAAELSRRRTELALDVALRRGITSRTAVHEAIARNPHGAGVRTIRPLLDPAGPSSVTLSPPEERLYALLRRGGVPLPEANLPIGDPFSPIRLERYRPDMMWRAQHVVVEYDGDEFHSGERAIAYDARRDAEMIRAGWRVIRLVDADLSDRPEWVLVQIAGALGQGSAGGG